MRGTTCPPPRRKARLLGAGNHVFHEGDGQPLAHPRALIDPFVALGPGRQPAPPPRPESPGCGLAASPSIQASCLVMAMPVLHLQGIVGLGSRHRSGPSGG